MTEYLEVQIYNLTLAEEQRKENQRRRSRKSYERRFKITEDMTIQERLQVQRNIQNRQMKAKNRYVGEVRDTQRERARSKYIKITNAPKGA